MTDIDTAAIRADANRMAKPNEYRMVIALCDALDAARTERDLRHVTVVHDCCEWRQEETARAEAAEARIAATREILRDAYDRGDFEAIDRALTEGTTP